MYPKLIVSLLWLLLLAIATTTTLAFTIAPTRSSNGVSSQQQQQQQSRRWASSQEEDLELTRTIIRQHEERLAAAAAKATTATSSSIIHDDDNDHHHPTTDRPKNDLMIRAAFGEQIEQTPVWLFRQAGRHLPEYEEYKQRTNRNFLQLLQDPPSVAECTLQPIRRYNVDAAILFSDILVIAEALNVPVTMPGGVGIQIPHPLLSPDDMTTRLPVLDATTTTASFVQDKLGHVMEAIRQIRIAMKNEGKSIPLIGFSAAPWTLMYYMVGGSSKKNTDIGVKWLSEHPEASQTLLNLLTTVIVEYLSAQVTAGVHMLQIFEAMGMMIDDEHFRRYAVPCLRDIATALRQRHPTIPLLIFCRGACHLNEELVDLGYDVITMDGSVDRSTARATVGPNVTLQGNYDPSELIVSNGKTVDTVRQTARTMLEELGPLRLIANLGEGLGGKESPELVDAFVTAIHEESAAMINQQQQQQLEQQR